MKRRKPLVWIAVSLLCFAGAIYFWQWGERRAAERAETSGEPASGTVASTDSNASTGSLLSASGGTNTTAAPSLKDERFPNRLRNTPAPLKELGRSDTGLILENALLDTALGNTLPIPDHLRSQGDPGAYIVQARGIITESFRRAIRNAGAEIVSYVPNNAYLIRGTAGAASVLGSDPLTQSVTPFEPYFKIKGSLLDAAVKQEPLPNGTMLTLVTFADAVNTTTEPLNQLGAELVSQDRSPFGPVLRVRVPEVSIAQIAGLSGVQIVDWAYVRTAANDLVRPRIGVAGTSVDETNYLALTGEGVLVQVVDSGVDASHPDFQSGRVSTDPALDPANLSLTDTDGHGTHVAGIIAGNGSQSTNLLGTNVSGSSYPPVPGQFRGMAPAADILSLGAITGGLTPPPTDSQLQESAATNGALISNNSWRQLGDTSYDIVAASYDAATRDALPEVTGPQPVLYVFAAGNEGQGNDGGTGGFSDTLGSPATAKNVISVGAIEQLRELTNSVITTNDINGQMVVVTNDPPFEFDTDTDYEVASFSSRGNVGIGLEGEFGRFKPDVVAPGEFVISTRSGQWDTNAYYYPTSSIAYATVPATRPVFPGELLQEPRELFSGTVELQVWVAPSPTSPLPFPDLPVYVRTDRPPQIGDPPQGTNVVIITDPSPLDTEWYIAVGNPTEEMVLVNLTTIVSITNALDPVATQARQELNAEVADYYRYESGTSMAAPAISGTLALVQEFYSKTFGANPSPALLKALLINASRSTSPNYDFQVNNVINFQGWGIPYLPNLLPALSNSAPNTASAVHFFEQSVDDALVTGQQTTRNVAVAAAAANQSLRFTLVWTDPPGNPLVGAKLVNDLDLVVTNLDTGTVYFGNDIPASSDFTEAWDTNSEPNIDIVNNVENVFLPPFSGTNFSVTVIGKRINVNALTADPDDTAQDYVLVASSGDASVDTALTITTGTLTARAGPQVDFLTPSVTTTNLQDNQTQITQGTLVQNQRVGENSPLLGSTNGISDSVNSGVADQWRFFVLTNEFDFTNATFVTFLPGTLSEPRMGVNVTDAEEATRIESDIDLYVTQNPTITNLNPVAINDAVNNGRASRSRGGTEYVVLTNANNNAPYYMGIKSEDHEAADFSFFGAFSLLPSSSGDSNGVTMYGIPLPSIIPDGSPQQPRAALVLGVATSPVNVRRVVVTNEVTHENIGDLFGKLSHGPDFAVLNNHSFPEDNDAITNYTYIYEDLGEGDIAGAQTTDGPGSLRNFSGKPGVGVWLLSMVDDALTQTGQVDDLIIRLDKSAETNVVSTFTVQPGGWVYDVIEVPPEATNLTFNVSISGSDPLPVELYVLREDFPDLVNYDYRVPVAPPGRVFQISTQTLPPLQAGRYFYGIYNPNATAQIVSISIQMGLGLDGRDKQTIATLEPDQVLDDAVSYAYQTVETDRRIAGLEVAMVVEHPRVSDLAVHLISPQGKRVLLVENRGGTDPNGFGGGSAVTNVFPTTFPSLPPPDGASETNAILEVGATQGTLIMNYSFFAIPDKMTVYYDGDVIYDIVDTGTNKTFTVDFGPGTNTFLEIVMNEGGNTNANTAWEYTPTVISRTFSSLVFTEDEEKTTTPIKFAVPPLGGLLTAPPSGPVFNAGFEGAAPGTYVAGQFINGWSVVTNDVDLFDNTYQGISTVPEGVNFLDINGSANTTNDHKGLIRTNLTLQAGQAYVLTFDYARNPDTVQSNVFPEAAISIGTDSWTVSPTGTEGWTNINWLTFSSAFVADATNGVLEARSLTGGTNGVLLDNFTISPTETLDRYYLPEESLSVLAGDNSAGLWTLELWDKRVGASNGPPQVLSWELRFNYVTVNQTPIEVQPGVTITNSIPPGSILYLVVEVPGWAVLAANSLLFAEPDPVITWFNQTNAPALGGTNANDIELIPLSKVGGYTLELSGNPPLIPNERYYLGIENPGTNTVSIGFQVDFDITELTNGIPFTKTNNGVAPIQDYYRFQVVNPVQRVQFEILQPTVDMTLVVRKDLPLPTFDNFDYLSANPGTNEEFIVVLPGSSPVPVSAGDWYLTAYNLSGMAGSYQIKATQWNTTGQPITLSSPGIQPGGFCFSWNSLVGGKYVVQAKMALTDTNWVDHSGTIEATGPVTSYCVPLPSPFHYFQVIEGVAVDANSTAQISIRRISAEPNVVTIEWLAPPIFQFDVEYSDVFPPVWNLVPGGPITSTDGNFTFIDDGSQTGGLPPIRYYRLILLP